MKRLSLLGIDGSGKTTVMQGLRRERPGQASYLFSPDFHEIEGFALADESRALTELSKLADVYSDPVLKLATLYLRMCLFGEAELFLKARARPRTLCIERHPLVDALTYLPVYAGALKKSGAPLENAERTLERIGGTRPELVRVVRDAIARRNRRLELSATSVGALAAYCVEHAGLPAERFVASVQGDFQTTLPDTVLYLDLGPEAALERLRQSGRPLEVHETLEHLTRLDRLAKSKLVELSALGVECVTLPAAALSAAELAEAVAGHFGKAPA